jgi:hypothetical protein
VVIPPASYKKHDQEARIRDERGGLFRKKKKIIAADQPNSLLQAEKSHYYPIPCTALWGERGRGSLALQP